MFASLRSLKLTASGVFLIIRYEAGLSRTWLTMLFLDKIGFPYFSKEVSSVVYVELVFFKNVFYIYY